MIDPIIIVGMPRSGTSMTAGIFHLCGAWVGTCRNGDRRNAKGYFENQPIKFALLDWYGARLGVSELLEPRDGWKEHIVGVVRKDGYRNGPWVAKHSAKYWPVWHEFENAKYVCCWRNIEANIESCISSRMIRWRDEDTVRRIAHEHHDAMRQIPESRRFDVATDRVAHGEFRTIRAAVEGCGLTFDQAKVEEFVDASLWHF